jgi:hypothetical protein
VKFDRKARRIKSENGGGKEGGQYRGADKCDHDYKKAAERPLGGGSDDRLPEQKWVGLRGSTLPERFVHAMFEPTFYFCLELIHRHLSMT